MTQAVYEIVVVGAGIVGAACAYELARRGMHVAVVDRDVVGSGASAAGMGHIVVMDDSVAQFALTRYSQRLWQELKPELPEAVEYEQCGTIWVAADTEEMEVVSHKSGYYARRGVSTEVIDAHRLRQLEPNLRNGLAGGLLVPEDAVLYPPCAALFLMKRAQDLGATLRLGVSAIQIAHGQALLSDGSEISGEIIVNAIGSKAQELTPGIDVKPRKGHLAINW
jgi:glycine/D-amino acid oxidase-like deaminating enzyme